MFRYDQTFFNDAISVMEGSRDLEKVMDLARKYFSLERSSDPLIEVLANGNNRIIKDIPIDNTMGQ